jgi:hypothetical protein
VLPEKLATPENKKSYSPEHLKIAYLLKLTYPKATGIIIVLFAIKIQQLVILSET